MVGHAPPPVPEPLTADAKVKVVLVGWPVDVNVPLKEALLSPPKVKVVPDGKLVQVVEQVTVAVVPLPLTEVTTPPTYPVTV